jgi:prolyl 4-hydroxylase
MNHLICINPLVYCVDDFLTHAECDLVIKLASEDSKWRTQEFSDAKVQGELQAEVSKGRVAKNTWLKNETPALRPILEKITNKVLIPLPNAESLQVVHYDVGGKYEHHYDSFSQTRRQHWMFTPDGCNGQRTMTVILYLNTPEEGGSTTFPRLKTTVQAKKGRALVFSNLVMGTDWRHPLSEHSGDPVIKGEKWMANLWYRIGRFAFDSETHQRKARERLFAVPIQEKPHELL